MGFSAAVFVLGFGVLETSRVIVAMAILVFEIRWEALSPSEKKVLYRLQAPFILTEVGNSAEKWA